MEDNINAKPVIGLCMKRKKGGPQMDMSSFNESIKSADDNVTNDGPRFPDGKYLMSVVGHEDKQKFPKAGTDPIEYGQAGLWVTFRILSGEHQGRDYNEYFGLSHLTSEMHVRIGMSALKRIYRAVNFVPNPFASIYGKRFVATLKSKKTSSEDNPWSTNIAECEAAPAPQGETFEQTVAKTEQAFSGQAFPGNVIPPLSGHVSPGNSNDQTINIGTGTLPPGTVIGVDMGTPPVQTSGYIQPAAPILPTMNRQLTQDELKDLPF